MKSIFFSIIIPTYNRGDMIRQTLMSILAQKEVSLEVIVIDDGSTDNTEAAVKSVGDERIRYFKIANGERGAARNTGLKIASGEYINYFDSDDIYNPCLEHVHRFILDKGFPSVVYGRIENVMEDGKRFLSGRRKIFKDAILHNNFLACGSVFLKKNVALRWNFSEDRRLSGTEDWELWLRLYAEEEFIECPQVIFQQHFHSQRSLSTADADRVRDREECFSQHILMNWRQLRQRFSNSELKGLLADRQTLIALYQFQTGNRKYAIASMSNALKFSFRVVLRKRFWALVKKTALG